MCNSCVKYSIIRSAGFTFVPGWARARRQSCLVPCLIKLVTRAWVGIDRARDTPYLVPRRTGDGINYRFPAFAPSTSNPLYHTWRTRWRSVQQSIANIHYLPILRELLWLHSDVAKLLSNLGNESVAVYHKYENNVIACLNKEISF